MLFALIQLSILYCAEIFCGISKLMTLTNITKDALKNDECFIVKSLVCVGRNYKALRLCDS